MDEYQALDMYDLIERTDVPPDMPINKTLWARRFKWTTPGAPPKFAPRWCVVGTNMDRDMYDSFADTVKWLSVCIIGTIGAAYYVYLFHFDVKNAFQSTRTDIRACAPKLVKLNRILYVEQAPGHVIKGADGKAKICQLKVGMQGGIDAAYLFAPPLRTRFKHASTRAVPRGTQNYG